MLSAAQLQERGKQAADEGRLAAARKWSQLALARDPGPDTRAEALLQLAMVAAETEGLSQGLEFCRQAGAIHPVSEVVRGHVHARLGLLAMRAGDFNRSLEEFAAAEPLLRSDARALTGLLINKGNIALQRRWLDAAAADFLAAIDLTDSELERAKARHNLGYAEYLRGNLTVALDHMRRAAPVLDPLSPAWRAVNQSDRAEVLSACGLPEQAAAELESAARAFALRRLRQSQAEAELARARILLDRDPTLAAKLARRAARRFRARGSEDWALRAEVVALGGACATTSPAGSPPAAATLHRALTARRHRVDAQTTALYAASAAVARGRDDEAARWLRRARIRPTDSLESRLLSRQVRAEYSASRGRRAQALGHLRAGLDELHDWLSAFGSLDLQSALVGRGRGLAADGLELAVHDGRTDVVFEWFERARVLVSRVTPVRSPAEPEAVLDLAELRTRQARGDDTAALKERIRERAWFAPSIGRSAQPVELSTVQASLGEDALVSYVLTERALTALVVTSTSARVVGLGSPGSVLATLPTVGADLEMAATVLPARLAQAVGSSLRERLVDLSRALVDPVLPLLPADGRLVVVPAGGLAGVPWTLLPALRGRPLSVARSATHWWVARRDDRASYPKAGFVSGPGVARAAEEVRRAALAWGSAAQVSINGPAAEVSRIAAEVDVLHVAAHGRHSADNPLFSGVELTGGPWFGYDIDQLSQVPEVVLLSACELGRSTVRGAEELVGMTTAWLHAGTRCVIASPAAVNDDAAAELLPLVHRQLASGSAPAQALAEALTAVDALAAFACYGSGW